MNNPTFLKHSHSYTYPPMKMEQTECSETSAYKIQTPGNYPEESIQILSLSIFLKLVVFILKNPTILLPY